MSVNETDKRWWLHDEPHKCIYENVIAIANHDNRRERYRLWRALYDDDDEYEPGDDENLDYRREQIRRDNIVANGADTVHAKITKGQPRPIFLTVGGDWEATERAEMMTRWMDGEFERLGLYELGSEVCHEAIKVGHGAALFYESPLTHRPAAEIVFAEDLHVDPREAFYRSERSMYRVVAVDREVLAETYPKHAKTIRDVEAPDDETITELSELDLMKETAGDMVIVVEAWRLPTKQFDEPLPEKKRKGEDFRKGRGRHVICIADVCLLDDEWMELEFPVVEFPWNKPSRKHFGTGLVKRMAGSQAEVDRLSEILYESAGSCVPSIWIPREAEVNTKAMDNDTWNIYEYSGGVGPVVLNPEPVGPMFMQILQNRIQLTYQSNGVSEMNASSEVPAQFKSGKAITTYNDIQTERFMPQGRAYERFYVEAAKRIVSIMENVASRGGEDAKDDALEVLGGDARGLELVKYADARLADTPYTIRCFPVSKLSTAPSARIDEVNALAQMGVLSDMDEVRELLDFPDLDRHNDIQSAAKDDVRQAIHDCKRTNKKQPTAHSFMPLDYAIKLGTQMFSLWNRRGAPDAVKQRLRNFVAHAESIKRQQQEAAAAAAAPPAGPMGPAVPPMGPAGPPMPPGGGEPMPAPVPEVA